MNVAIGTWTLVLGGWVLPVIDGPGNAPGPPAWQMTAAQPGSPTRGPQARPTDRSASSPRRAGRASGLPGTGRQVTPRRPYMPLPPTDRSAAYGGYPLAPTQTYRSPQANQAAGRPAYRRPNVSYAARQATERASRAAAQRRTKPFSSYRPEPAVSPYLNLFRFEDNEVFDNVNSYYTQVKPFVDQRYRNTRVGGEIHSLQNTSRFQSTALQYLGRETQRLQGTAQPQRYMDYRNYYPGLGN